MTTTILAVSTARADKPHPSPSTYSQPEPSYSQNTAPYYDFEWRVADQPSRNDYGHKEERDGDSTKGKYYVDLSDGRTQVVDYSVDGYGGYVAQVSYTGEAAKYEPSGHKKPIYQAAPVRKYKAAATYKRPRFVRKPAEAYEKPAEAYEKPTTTYQEPTPKYQKPAPEYKKPALTFQKPAATHQKPTPVYTEPAATHSKPTPAYVKPAATYKKPTPINLKPVTTYRKPTPAYEKPEPKYQKPELKYQKPKSSYKVPEPSSTSGRIYFKPNQAFTNIRFNQFG